MDNPRRSAGEQAEFRDRAYAAAPFLDPGGSARPTHYECAAWPEPVSRPLPWLTGNAEVPPTLTVSVTGDPGTPHKGGITVAERLRGSLLTVEGAQHGVAFVAGNLCVDDAVATYLIDLRTPPTGAHCTI
ncbi:alpha/beta hydrolase [Pseudonocardia sp. HH130630-07]|uniref:alpha/beta hydrolase n=1 Tax=Pseudonocardia sp. HH130630-07 TaxID=1690815 RepID=UPI003FA681A1